MIKLQIIGHLGKDCVVNTVNGRNVINFTVAHTEKYKDSQGNQQEKTIWVDCGYWTDRTVIAQWLTKGKLVYVEGRPDVRSYQKNDGTPGAALSMMVRDVQFVGGRADGGSAPSYSGNTGASAPSSSNVPSPNDISEPIDDLPF